MGLIESSQGQGTLKMVVRRATSGVVGELRPALTDVEPWLASASLSLSTINIFRPTTSRL